MGLVLIQLFHGGVRGLGFRVYRNRVVVWGGGGGAEANEQASVKHHEGMHNKHP